MRRSIIFSASAVLCLSACAQDAAAPMAPGISDLADAWIAGFSRHDPLEARLWGVETDPQQLIRPVTESEMREWRSLNRDLEVSLASANPESLPAAERTIHANLRNKVEVELALTECHREFWPLSHVAGWHLNLPNSMGEAILASGDGMSESRLDAWAGQLVAYMDAEDEMLEAGLARGYSTPRSIAGQVADQMEALGSVSGPLSPAALELDQEISEHWESLLRDRVGPRFSAHAQHIRETYLPRARTDRSIAALPSGTACYRASVFQHTGLQYTPDALLEMADTIQARAEAGLVSAGQELWGLDDAGEIRARFDALADAELAGEEAALAAAQADADRLIAVSAHLFPALPTQTVTVTPYPAEQRPSLTASYRPDFERGFAGVYSLNPDSPRMLAARTSEAITSHEVAPGHHTQAMIAYQAGSAGDGVAHPILTIGMNNTFVEGWAQYAEFLAAEERLLAHPETRIGVWVGHGDVIPLAVRFNTGQASEAETAHAALIRRGTPDAPLSEADNVLDWLAVMPGQILSYDIGADALLTLRDRARTELGDRFDYPTFHRLVLEEGSVPLWRVEEKVNAWIERTR